MRVRGTNSHGAGEWAGPVGALTNYAWPRSPALVTALARVLDGGTELRMPFYEDLDRTAGRTPPRDLFQVTAGGAPVTIGDVLIRENEPGNVYLIGLSPAIRRGRTVTVSYRDPTPIDGTAVLQGTNGADVHSFSNARVKNWSSLDASDPGVGPAPASARVDSDGDTVIVSFDEDVDGSSIPGSDAFAVTVGGTGVTVSGAGSGDRANDVHIEIDGAIVRDRTVTVSYTRPTSGNAIQDIDGNASVSFSDYPVVSTQARQSAPPEPLTATFEDLPGFHNGSAAFTVLLAFSEEFPVTEESIRAGLTVSGGAPGAVAQTESGKNRRWDIAVTPSAAAAAVSIALTPKESCAAEGAICTEDGRGLEDEVEAEVPGREPTRVVSATVTSDPGENGAWDTGETVVVEVRFSREVSLSGPPNATPAIGIALDGTRRDADYESGSGSHALRFEYAVTADDDGAARARVVANSLEANGAVIGDAEGYEAELGFSVAPELSVADAEGTEGTDTAIAFTVTLAPAAATEVTVHYATADGSATAPADYTSTSSTLTFEPGQTSKTVEVPIADDDEEDSGETFTLVLSEPSGAVLADGEATGTIRNTEAQAAPLTAEFRDLPDGHGVKPFTFELRFSEELPLGYKRLRDAAFRVTNGSVTAARRVTAGKHRVWDVTVTPSGDGAVTVALPETTDCAAAGAICTADQRMLAAVSATVPETAPAGAAFRVRLADVPREHAGTGEITFRVLFNKHPGTDYSYKTLRDKTLRIRQGGESLTPKVRRLNKPHNDRWEVKVTPGSKEDLTVSVGPFSVCTEAGAVCTARDLLTGTSFALTGEAGGAGSGTVSLWGRGAVSRFDGREGDLTLSGEVTSAMLGADWLRDAWTVGLLVSHSRGEGSYQASSRSERNRGADAGTVTSSLTGLYPYGRYMVNERLSVWGAAGYGEGTLTLTPEGQAAIGTAMDLKMGAVGVRGVAVEAPAEGGVELAVTSDAMAVRTASEKTAGLAGADAEVTRLRLGLEGTWRGLEAGGGELVPRLEVGLRHDGGDAETGFGFDLGGGLSWSHPASGLSAELSGRGLLTHESQGFRDRGLSASFGWDPGRGSGRGPKLTLSQTVGAQASGGMDALLGRETLTGLAANDNGDDLANRRLEVTFGYGFPAFGDRFTSTPEFGLGLGQGRREYSLGWRLNLAQTGPTALELRLQATRSESAGAAANDNTAEHGIGLTVTARW